ncbi:hypothetical protein BCR35DRAFT_274736 [Leucosporidium creatinivorum]|uniref:CUE domain-containing protein n=1 Tax=Leucosporidium creatinivorum TaxID=106004 RepID=A0A1Y2G5H7_9BASI|nr:hypothetical protein BCR35DRAFT_274736 [Leucosporidium creatinivorum]
MTFAGAPVSKGLIIVLCFCSILAAIASRQYLFNVPLSPHLTRDRQLWRLPIHHLVFANSSELFLGVLLLFYTSVPVERSFGSRKFASFLVVNAGLATVIEFVALILGSRLGFHTIPAGPFAIIFSIFFQSRRLIPTSFHWKVFGVEITNRIAGYVLAVQLISSQPPASIVVSLIGVLSSQLYLSNFLSIRHYRISQRLTDLLARLFAPLLGDEPTPRRPIAATQRDMIMANPVVAFPNSGAFMRATGIATAAPPATAAQRRPATTTGSASPATAAAPVPPPPSNTTPSVPQPSPATPGFVQQWAQGITGAQSAPTAAQIAELSAIFPDQPREAVINALQRNQLDVSRAAAALLVS